MLSEKMIADDYVTLGWDTHLPDSNDNEPLLRLLRQVPVGRSFMADGMKFVIQIVGSNQCIGLQALPARNQHGWIYDFAHARLVTRAGKEIPDADGAVPEKIMQVLQAYLQEDMIWD